MKLILILFRAAYWGKLDVLEFLVFVGGDIKSIDSMGRTPAEVAFHRNNMPVFDFLENSNFSFQLFFFILLCFIMFYYIFLILIFFFSLPLSQ